MDEVAQEPSPVETSADIREPSIEGGESAGPTAFQGAVAARPKPMSLHRAIIQAKLSVGAADDPYEREADRVADRVVRSLRVNRAVDLSGRDGEADAGGELAGQDSEATVARRVAASATQPGRATAARTPARRRVQRAHHPARFDVPLATALPISLTSSPTPIAPKIRRMPIQRDATIGAAGGDVDTDTEQRVQRARGRGSELPPEAREPMEQAFGADLGHIRVHAGSSSAELNDRIQAKAFTTGNDIFFRDGLPDTSTSSGQHLLAHELTHTFQQGGVQRSAAIMRKWWKFGRKKKPMEISGPTDSAMLEESTGQHGDTRAELESRGYTLQPIQQPAGGDSGEAEQPWSGQAGSVDGPGVETAKPTAAIATAATAGGIAGGVSGEVGAAGGVGGGALGLLTAGDAALGLANAYSMNSEANTYGDDAMSKQASGKAKDQSAALGMGLATTGKGVASAVDVFQGTAGAAVPSAAAVAAGSLGVVGGSAMVIQGAWRGGKAVMKLCRLVWGRAQTMYSPDGERWKQAIVAAEQFKAAVNGLKILAGGLAIAAGALIIAGSPIGWAIGIAAAVGAGALAISKIIGKVRNAWDKSKAASLEGAKLEIGLPEDVTMAQAEGRVDVMEGLSNSGYDTSQFIAAGPQNEPDRGEGFSSTGNESAGNASEDDAAARQAVIEEADRVAVLASKNATIAAELRHALSHGDKDLVSTALEAASEQEDFDMVSALIDPDDARLHDSFMLLSAINIDPDQALAASGQTLIEKKLSKAEAM